MGELTYPLLILAFILGIIGLAVPRYIWQLMLVVLGIVGLVVLVHYLA